jgi:hypothetical protein
MAELAQREMLFSSLIKLVSAGSIDRQFIQ